MVGCAGLCEDVVFILAPHHIRVVLSSGVVLRFRRGKVVGACGCAKALHRKVRRVPH